jgi:hypothetical protein
MNEVKWSWKDVLEMVGVLGVIASLIFVAFQIRQNTRAIESSTIEAILSHSYDAVVLTVENADLRAAQVAACNGALTGDQREQLIAYYRALLRLQLNRFFQVQLGILDEETALALGGRATPYRRPIFAELWEETKDDYTADFQDFVRRGILPMVEKTC